MKVSFEDYKKALDAIECARNTSDKILESQSLNEEEKQLLTNLAENSEVYSEFYRSIDVDKSGKRLSGKLLKRVSYARKRRNLYRVISVASAVAIGLIVTILMMTLHGSDGDQYKQEISYNRDAQIDEPTLIFETGERITLDNENVEIEIEKFKSKTPASVVPADSVSGRVDQIRYNTIVIPAKRTLRLVLGDHSVVTLNANTKLRYPVTFLKDSREVFLDGEAFFEVAKDSVPFIVNTSKAKVRVYGTSFNVNSSICGAFETVLVQGSVGITKDDAHAREVLLKPNQMFRMTDDECLIKDIDAQNYITWIESMFDFNNEPLEYVLDKIGRWYGVTFICQDKTIGGKLISIFHRKNVELKNLLSALQCLTDCKFVEEEGGVYRVETSGN